MRLIAAFVCIALILSLFGCTATPPSPQPQPDAGANTLVLPPTDEPNTPSLPPSETPSVPNAPNTANPAAQQGNIANLPTLAHELTGTPASQEASALPSDLKVTCKVSVREGSYLVGDKVYVDISAYTGSSGVNFTYKCGERAGMLSSGGIVDNTIFCQFASAGNNTVEVLANGHVCAEKAVFILPARGTCFIDSASVKRDLSSYYYEATVYFDGFTTGDPLKWVCDYTTTTRTFTSDPVLGMPRSESIYCDFPSKPKRDAIYVYMGDVPCGEISTR